MKKRRIAILGSTGSIGTQALEVIEAYPDIFFPEVLTANRNADLLIEQALKFSVNSVAIIDDSLHEKVFRALNPYGIKVFAGEESLCELAAMESIDIVLTAIVGFSGLKPTISAIKAGKTIALANKETLVAAGSIITSLAKEYGSPIIPIDSEHSAIFQLLEKEKSCVERIILTASGGPFIEMEKEVMDGVAVEEALAHPVWQMGRKISIDSATMMNKGLEMIEAHWLFEVDPNRIEIVVHPQSIVHSMVEFADGSVTAQMSYPDMRLPIQYALSYPYRLPLNNRRIDFPALKNLCFRAPAPDKFPAITIAYEALRRGGNIPCAMSAANEVAVKYFLDGKIPFGHITRVVGQVVDSTRFIEKPTIDEIYGTDILARTMAESFARNR